MSASPTERERQMASRLFQRPIGGDWTAHIATFLAEYREEICARLVGVETYGNLELANIIRDLRGLPPAVIHSAHEESSPDPAHPEERPR